MLGAAELDAAGELVEKRQALRGKHGQEAMGALLKLAVGVEMGEQFALGERPERRNAEPGHGQPSP